jgi:peptide/nickel transport system ATP-binding protein
MIGVSDLNVVFTRGKHAFHAVRDVSFRVEKGQSFGLVGESGSGKTTVLRALAGLLDQVAQVTGAMMVAGEQLERKRSRSFRRRVQMVFQDPYGSLHPRHTVDAILSEPARVHRIDRIKERVITALEEVGLDASFRFRYPHQISGGQRQRVSVARALIIEPDIVLLDEPTSALDVSVQAEVLNLLMRLKRERGLTYVLVSHDLSVVAHMCESLSVMQNGAIVETMSVQQLREHTPTQPYTRQLLTASLGYDRAAIDAFKEFNSI